MPFEVGTKDCTALSDAELAEMADLCVDRAPGFDIGFLSKQCEEWVLVSLVREGTQAARLFVLHARAHRWDAVAARRGGHRRPDGQGRAGHAAPSRRPVPAGAARLPRRGRPRRHPAGVVRGLQLVRGPGRCRAPAGPQGRRARSGPGVGAWPSASALRAGSTTGRSSWPGDGSTAGSARPGRSQGEGPCRRGGRPCSEA